MSKFRASVEKHPLPWFFSSLFAAFISGVGTYQAVVSWSGMKIVRDESDARNAVRIETSPSDAKIEFKADSAKFFQGMSLAEGANEFAISKQGYKSQRIRVAKNGRSLVFSVPLERIPSLSLVGTKTYKGERISLSIQDVDIQFVLQSLLEFTGKGLNVIFVQPLREERIKLSLKDVPWDQALDVILAIGGLEMKESENVVFIDYAP